MKKTDKLDVKELKGTKSKKRSDWWVAIVAGLFTILVFSMYMKTQGDLGKMKENLQNVTADVDKLSTWAQYFSPAAIDAINGLAAQQQNMTNRIILLELQNGIMPPELVKMTNLTNSSNQ